MFTQDTKLAVLESKLSIYENLSKEMLSKLEMAVEKISESNNRIANILSKHDQRIEHALKTDELIIKMIEDLGEKNKDEIDNLSKRVDTLEKKFEDFSRIRWVTLGAIVVITFVIAQSSSIISILSPKTIHTTPQLITPQSK